MPAFESSEVRLFRRDWRAVGKAAALLLAGPALIWLGAVPGGLGGMVTVLVGYLAMTAGFAMLVSDWRVLRPVKGWLQAGEAGVSWEGRVLTARRRIRAGFVIPGDGGPPRVRLVRRFPWKPITLQIPDEPAGRALLSALGLDAAQTLATLELASLLRTQRFASVGNWGCGLVVLLGIPCAIAPAVAIGGWTGALLPLVPALAACAWLTLSVLPARARVGADGVLVTWLWRKRFIPYAELQAVRPFIDAENAGVSLLLAGGDEVKLPVMGLFTATLGREELTLRVKRIEQAVDVHRRALADRSVLLPARGQRSAAAWVGALRAIASGAGAAHRTAPVEVETLFRIAEDAGGEPARRIAAAVALGGAMAPAGRERLRIAAATTAAPELREALALAAEEQASDEALAAAIERASGS